mmetsp:Transcript_62115/g.162765  ORF Transcript_62115/g.162765 Transcript_62115/m.162765 type:complete len:289 (+) Transcript_62115:391-1257(+)
MARSRRPQRQQARSSSVKLPISSSRRIWCTSSTCRGTTSSTSSRSIRPRTLGRGELEWSGRFRRKRPQWRRLKKSSTVLRCGTSRRTWRLSSTGWGARWSSRSSALGGLSSWSENTSRRPSGRTRSRRPQWHQAGSSSMRLSKGTSRRLWCTSSTCRGATWFSRSSRPRTLGRGEMERSGRSVSRTRRKRPQWRRPKKSSTVLLSRTSRRLLRISSTGWGAKRSSRPRALGRLKRRSAGMHGCRGFCSQSSSGRRSCKSGERPRLAGKSTRRLVQPQMLKMRSRRPAC